LDEASIRSMLGRPPGAPGLANGKPSPTYYGCGWDVRPIAEPQGKFTKWHGGLLAGSSTFMLGRDDGINWAVVFNRDADPAGKEYAGMIDMPLHKTANQIKDWPDVDLYGKFAL
jgi:hypothetical protein